MPALPEHCKQIASSLSRLTATVLAGRLQGRFKLFIPSSSDKNGCSNYQFSQKLVIHTRWHGPVDEITTAEVALLSCPDTASNFNLKQVKFFKEELNFFLRQQLHGREKTDAHGRHVIRENAILVATS